MSKSPRYLFFCESRLMIDTQARQPCRLDAERAGELLEQAIHRVVVGEDEQGPIEAVAIRRFRPTQRIPGADFEPLRSIAHELAATEWPLLARGHSLLQWQQAHRFCGWCGHPTDILEGGHRRRCSNPECGQLHFPRTDPAVIMRITHGQRVLLGRQPSWPAQRRSVLAGFVAPGESAEQGVIREVAEEAGIRVAPESIRYFGSQHWPFPGSLMLAYTARAETTRLSRPDEELAEVDWWSRAELEAALRADRISLPGTKSVARQLIDDWRDHET